MGIDGAEESSFGLMDRITQDTGEMAWQMGEED